MKFEVKQEDGKRLYYICCKIDNSYMNFKLYFREKYDAEKICLELQYKCCGLDLYSPVT